MIIKYIILKNYLRVVVFHVFLVFLLGACNSSKNTTKGTLDLYESSTITVQEFSQSADVSSLEKVTGALNYSGSEPFAIPTIFVTEGTSYKLMGDVNFIKTIYPDINGKTASLYGKVIQNGSLVYFEVHYYELITENP